MSETKRKLATLDANGNLVPFRYGGKYPERLHDKVVVCATFDAEGNEIPLPFFGGQEGGTIPENIQYLAEVSENTALRHDHPHMETINAFSEESGGLLWNGQPIQGGGGGSALLIIDSLDDLPDASVGGLVYLKRKENYAYGDIEHDDQYAGDLYMKDLPPAFAVRNICRKYEGTDVIQIGTDELSDDYTHTIHTVGEKSLVVSLGYGEDSVPYKIYTLGVIYPETARVNLAVIMGVSTEFIPPVTCSEPLTGWIELDLEKMEVRKTTPFSIENVYVDTYYSHFFDNYFSRMLFSSFPFDSSPGNILNVGGKFLIFDGQNWVEGDLI